MTTQDLGQLRFLKSDGSGGKAFSLKAECCTIGSSMHASIRMMDKGHGLKEIHCVIDVDKNGVATLSNKAPLNPVKLNGQNILKNRCLKPGDILTIVDKRLRYENENICPEILTSIDNVRNIKTPRKPRMSMAVFKTRRISMTPEPKRVKPPIKRKRSNSFTNIEEFDIISEGSATNTPFKTPGRRKSIRVKMANSSFKIADISSSQLLPSQELSTPQAQNQFQIATPQSTVKPTLRNELLRNLGKWKMTEFTKHSDESDSDGEKRELRTPVAEVLENCDEDLINFNTPVNNTSVVLVDSPEEENLPVRSKKSFTKNISIQRLTQNDDSIIVLESPNSKTPKSMLRAKPKTPSTTLRKTNLISELEKEAISSTPVLESVESDSTKEVHFENTRRSRVSRSSITTPTPQSPKKSYAKTPRRNVKSVNEKDIPESPTDPDEDKFKTPNSNTPVLTKSTMKQRRSTIKMTDTDTTPKAVSPTSVPKSRRSFKNFDSMTSDSNNFFESETPSCGYSPKEEESFKLSPVKSIVCSNESVKQLSVNDNSDTSLAISPVANIPKRKAATEHKVNNRRASKRRSLGLLSETRTSETIEETTRSVNSSSFIYMSGDILDSTGNADRKSMKRKAEDEANVIVVTSNIKINITAPDDNQLLESKRDSIGVKLRTSMTQNEPNNDLSDPKGVKSLLKTQKIQNEPHNDLSDVNGVDQLFETPQANKELHNVSKQINQTPTIHAELESEFSGTPNHSSEMKLSKPEFVQDLFGTPVQEMGDESVICETPAQDIQVRRRSVRSAKKLNMPAKFMPIGSIKLTPSTIVGTPETNRILIEPGKGTPRRNSKLLKRAQESEDLKFPAKDGTTESTTTPVEPRRNSRLLKRVQENEAGKSPAKLGSPVSIPFEPVKVTPRRNSKLLKAVHEITDIISPAKLETPESINKPVETRRNSKLLKRAQETEDISTPKTMNTPVETRRNSRLLKRVQETDDGKSLINLGTPESTESISSPFQPVKVTPKRNSKLLKATNVADGISPAILGTPESTRTPFESAKMTSRSSKLLKCVQEMEGDQSPAVLKSPESTRTPFVPVKVTPRRTSKLLKDVDVMEDRISLVRIGTPESSKTPSQSGIKLNESDYNQTPEILDVTGYEDEFSTPLDVQPRRSIRSAKRKSLTCLVKSAKKRHSASQEESSIADCISQVDQLTPFKESNTRSARKSKLHLIEEEIKQLSFQEEEIEQPNYEEEGVKVDSFKGDEKQLSNYEDEEMKQASLQEDEIELTLRISTDGDSTGTFNDISSTKDEHVSFSEKDLIVNSKGTNVYRKLQKEPKNDLTSPRGVKKLLATPKVQKEPHNDISSPHGVKQLLKTPKLQRGPKNDLMSPRGVKQLMKTPKVQKDPLNDLSSPRGVKQLMALRKEQKEPNNDLSSPRGVKKLMATPKIQNEPNNDLTSPRGVKKLLKTPKIQREPLNDLSSPRGVKQLMAEPKEQKEPENNLMSPRGVKKLLATPKFQNSPKNDLGSPRGVKQLMKTPKPQREPLNDLSNPLGVKQLMASPRQHKDPINDLSSPRGVKQLMKSPKVQNSPNNDLCNPFGVKQLMASPKVQNEPKNDLSSPRGVKQLYNSPKIQKEPKNDLSDVEGVQELFHVSSTTDLNVSGIELLPDDDIFPKPLRTYSASPRKSIKEDVLNVSSTSDQCEMIQDCIQSDTEEEPAPSSSQKSKSVKRKRSPIGVENLENIPQGRKTRKNNQHISMEKVDEEETTENTINESVPDKMSTPNAKSTLHRFDDEIIPITPIHKETHAKISEKDTNPENEQVKIVTRRGRKIVQVNDEPKTTRRGRKANVQKEEEASVIILESPVITKPPVRATRRGRKAAEEENSAESSIDIKPVRSTRRGKTVVAKDDSKTVTSGSNKSAADDESSNASSSEPIVRASRRRGKKAINETPVVKTANQQQMVTDVDIDEVVEEKPKATRGRKKKSVSSQDTVEEPNDLVDKPKRGRKNVHFEEENESKTEEVIEKPAVTASTRSSKRTAKNPVVNTVDSEDKLVKPARGKTRAPKPASEEVVSSAIKDEGEAEKVTRTRKRTAKALQEIDTKTEDNTEKPVSATRSRKKTAKVESVESEDEEEEKPTTTRTRKRTAKVATDEQPAKKSRSRAPKKVEEAADLESENEENEEPKKTRAVRGKKVAKPIEEVKEDKAVPPKRNTRKRIFSSEDLNVAPEAVASKVTKVINNENLETVRKSARTRK